MANSISLHNVERIEQTKNQELEKSGTNSKHLEITYENGQKMTLKLFSDTELEIQNRGENYE